MKLWSTHLPISCSLSFWRPCFAAVRTTRLSFLLHRPVLGESADWGLISQWRHWGERSGEKQTWWEPPRLRCSLRKVLQGHWRVFEPVSYQRNSCLQEWACPLILAIHHQWRRETMEGITPVQREPRISKCGSRTLVKYVLLHWRPVPEISSVVKRLSNLQESLSLTSSF